MAAALATLGIGTETSGSIISPSSTQGIVGLRPTVGLVPGDGIAPIDVSQDTAGPMVRTVGDAALTLQSIAGTVPDDTEYADIFGPDYYTTGVIPVPPDPLPNTSQRSISISSMARRLAITVPSRPAAR